MKLATTSDWLRQQKLRASLSEAELQQWDQARALAAASRYPTRKAAQEANEPYWAVGGQDWRDREEGWLC